ncbi:MAG: 4Fe-4S dicluster domain-containing protein [Candidatus Helarchaeota archaeon]
MTTPKEVVNYDELDSSFIIELKKMVGDEILACFQCGMCTAGCPSAPFGYNIRQILKLAIWGFRNELLESDFIWFCTECGKCAERCTQNIEPYKIILGIQRLAARQGNIPLTVLHRIKQFMKSGRVVEVDELTELKRERYELPKCDKELPESVMRELEAILDMTEFRKSYKDRVSNKDSGDRNQE